MAVRKTTSKGEKRNKSEKHSILLSWMYAGSYPLANSNIGHEVINFKKSDDGTRYVYICKDGKLPPDRVFDAVFLVRSVLGRENKTVEIIAKVVGYKPILDKRGRLAKGDGVFTDKNEVRYNGVLLSEIYENNLDKNGELEGKRPISLTLTAKDVVRPAKRLFLTNGRKNQKRGVFHLDRPIFAEPGKEKFDEDDHRSDYMTLKGLADETALWKTTAAEDDLASDFRRGSFLLLAKQHHDELTYSNLIAHFLGTGQGILDGFLNEVLRLKPFRSGKKHMGMQISREEHHVDLTIRYRGYHIVIENKIRSGINGDQLKQYAKTALEECKKTKRKPRFFILSPEYNNTFDSEDLCKDVDGMKIKYKFISYGQLLQYFNTAYQSMPEENRPQSYEEFLQALALQDRVVDNFTDEIMQMRFDAAVKRAKARSENR